MAGFLLKNCAAVVVDDGHGATCLRDVDVLTKGAEIRAIGPDLDAGGLGQGVELRDATGWFVYPGLVNTHHYFFQTFVRNRADLDWTKLSVIEWLDLIYPIFSRLTEECFYHSSLTAMSELIKHGCTTAMDHQY